MEVIYDEEVCHSPLCCIKDSKSPKVVCKGFCKNVFHGICSGLPRLWFQSSLAKYVSSHFVCSNCIKIPDILNLFDNLWAEKFKCLENEISNTNGQIMTVLKNNNAFFEDVSGNLLEVTSVKDKLIDMDKNIQSMKKELNILLSSIDNDDLKQSSSKTSDKQEAKKQHKEDNDEPEHYSGWRNFGHKSVWKKDWRQYDEKVNRKKELNKIHLKQRKEKNRRIKNSNRFDNKKNVNIQNSNHSNTKYFNRNDATRKTMKPNKLIINEDNFNKQKWPPAVVQGIRNYQHNFQSKYSNFVNGGVVNPGNQKSVSFMDPLKSSQVNSSLISQVDPSSNRYILARFKYHKIYDTARIYLSYLHDKDAGVCVESLTSTRCKVMLSSEGLPTDYHQLKKLYVEFHEQLAQNSWTVDEIENDLRSYGNHLRQLRISHLQNYNESSKKFYTGTKNF